MDTENVRLSIRSDLRMFDTQVDAFRREFRLQCDLLLASLTIRFGWMLVTSGARADPTYRPLVGWSTTPGNAPGFRAGRLFDRSPS